MICKQVTSLFQIGSLSKMLERERGREGGVREIEREREQEREREKREVEVEWNGKGERRKKQKKTINIFCKDFQLNEYTR